MNELLERLAQFFTCYFHQDWAADGAKSWRDVISAFVRDETAENAEALARDLRDLLKSVRDEREMSGLLVTALRSDYDPRPELAPRAWIEAIVSQLDSLRSQS